MGSGLIRPRRADDARRCASAGGPAGGSRYPYQWPCPSRSSVHRASPRTAWVAEVGDRSVTSRSPASSVARTASPISGPRPQAPVRTVSSVSRRSSSIVACELGASAASSSTRRSAGLARPVGYRCSTSPTLAAMRPACTAVVGGSPSAMPSRLASGGRPPMPCDPPAPGDFSYLSSTASHVKARSVVRYGGIVCSLWAVPPVALRTSTRRRHDEFPRFSMTHGSSAASSGLALPRPSARRSYVRVWHGRPIPSHRLGVDGNPHADDRSEAGDFPIGSGPAAASCAQARFGRGRSWRFFPEAASCHYEADVLSPRGLPRDREVERRSRLGGVARRSPWSTASFTSRADV